VSPVAADVFDANAVAAAVRGHDAVVSAFNPGWNEPEHYDKFFSGSAAIGRGVEASGVMRLMVAGGAGSLFVAPGVQLVDTPDFSSHLPPNVVPGSLAARAAPIRLGGNTALDWTFLSPPAMIEPGERTGANRVGGDDLLMASDKPAGISVPDLAIATAKKSSNRAMSARFAVAIRL
jgi:uncharacterized protein